MCWTALHLTIILSLVKVKGVEGRGWGWAALHLTIVLPLIKVKRVEQTGCAGLDSSSSDNHIATGKS